MESLAQLIFKPSRVPLKHLRQEHDKQEYVIGVVAPVPVDLESNSDFDDDSLIVHDICNIFAYL